MSMIKRSMIYLSALFITSMVHALAFPEKGGFVPKEGGGCLPGFNCGGTPTPPAPPTNLVGPTTNTNGSYTLTWTSPSIPLFSSYELYETKNDGSMVRIASLSNTATSHSISGRSDGKYRYYLRSCRTTDTSLLCSGYTSSSYTTVKKIPSAPSAPANINDNDGSYTVSWSAVAGATYYNVQERLAGGSWVNIASNYSSSSISRSGKANNTTYQYQIQACNGESWACSGFSAYNTVKVRFAPSKPNAPVSLDSKSTSYTVSWSKPSGTVTHYNIQEKVGSGSWTNLALNHTSTSISRSGRTNNVNYQYRVQACNDFTCSSFGSANLVRVRLIPAAPTASISSSQSNGSVTVSWNKSANKAVYYDLQKRLGSGSWTSVNSGLFVNSKLVSGLTDGSWTFRVRACNEYSWSCSGYGSASASTTVRIIPSMPSAPSVPVNDVDGRFSVSWSKPSGNVTAYDVIEYKNGSSSYTLVAYRTSATSLTLSSRGNGSYTYRVRACNDFACSSYGSHSQSIPVRLKPSAPTPSISSSQSNGGVTVSWTSSPNSAVYYDLQKRLGSGSWTPVDSKLSTSSLSVSGLTDGSWSFRVQACNQYSWSCSGYGSASASTTVRLIPSVPSSPSVPANDVDGKFTVSWSKPSGTVTFYDVIEYKNGSSSYTVVANDTSATSLTLSGRGNGSYTYRVRACNDFACSSYSSHSQSTQVLYVPAAPASISVVAQSTSSDVEVSWATASGQVSEYRLEFQTNGHWEQIWSTPNATRKLVSGLTSGTYYFRIRACNASGCSSYTTSSLLTVAIKPQSPAIVELPEISTGEADISWSAVDHATYYDVQKRRNGGSWVTARVSDTKTSGKISGLTDGSWDFRVRACNGYAWSCSEYGADSGETLVRLVPTLPSAPSGPATSTNGSYTVSWSKPSGNVSVYELIERKNNGGQWSVVAKDTTATSAMLSGKTSGDYDYQVRACNQYGWACSEYSPVSEDVKVRLIPAAPVIASPTSNTDSDGKFSVSWNSVSHATFYVLEKQVNGGSWGAVSSNMSGTSYDVNESSDGVYGFRVKACNQYDWSCSQESDVKTVSVNIVPDFANKDVVEIPDAALVSIQVPEQQAVGAVQGQAGVSGGAATYSIPIAVPPGRNGMQPSVSLNYSSRSGNGVAGMGWNLNAAQLISRCDATFASDGFTKKVSFSETTDRLCLGGEKLKLDKDSSVSYGKGGAIYRLETNPRTIVKQYNDLNTNSSYFVVQLDNHQTLTFGLAEQAKHKLSGKSETLSWMLNTQKDQFGNQIDYEYVIDSGAIRLVDIFYTGDGTTKGDRQVHFDYEVRDDINESYMVGGLSKQQYRLTKITTKYQSSEVRNYTIDYGDYAKGTGRSLVRSVTECAGNMCLPATTFDWSESEINYDSAKRLPIDDYLFYEMNQRSSTVSVSQDINGDGVNELMIKSPYHSLGDLLMDGKRPNPEFISINSAGNFDVIKPTEHEVIANIAGSSRQRVDFDQDGKVDILYWKDDELYFASWNGGTFSSKSTGLSGKTDYHYVYDVNGDGLQDFVSKNVYYPNCSTKGNLKFCSAVELFNESTIFSGFSRFDYFRLKDIDGNGTLDYLVTLSPNENYGDLDDVYAIIYFERGIDGKLTAVPKLASNVNFPSKAQNLYYIFADLNGDGLQDILTAQNGFWNYQINLGDKTFGDPENTQKSQWLYEKRGVAGKTYWAAKSGVKVLDWNGDGKEELMLPGQNTLEYCVDYMGYRLGAESVNSTVFDLMTDGGSTSIFGLSAIDVHGSFFSQFHSLGGYNSITSMAAELQEQAVQAMEMTREEVDLLDVAVICGEGLYAQNGMLAQFDRGLYKYDAFSLSGTLQFVKNTTDITATPNHFSGDIYGNGVSNLFDIRGYSIKNFNRYSSGGEGMSGVTQADLVGGPGTENGIYEIKNASGHQDILQSVKNGLKHESRWEFATLANTDSRALGIPKLYEIPNDADKESLHLHQNLVTSSMPVVSVFHQQHGAKAGDECSSSPSIYHSHCKAGFNTKLYSYRNALVDHKGHGFQGFKQMIVDDLATGIRSVSNYHQTFPLGGQIKSDLTCLIRDEDEDCSEHALTNSSIDWTMIPDDSKELELTVLSSQDNFSYPPGSYFFIAPKFSVITNYDLVNRGTELYKVSESSTYDYLGNPLMVSNTYEESGSTHKRNVVTSHSYDYSDVSEGWLNKLKTITKTTNAIVSRNGLPIQPGTDTEQSISTTYESWNNRLPSSILVSPSSGKWSRTAMTYSQHGLLASKSLSAEGESSARVETSTFSSDGYFVKAVNNSLDHKVELKTSEKHGEVEWNEDINDVRTSFSYDSLGGLVGQQTQGASHVSTRMQWCLGYAPENVLSESCDDPLAAYISSAYQSGSPTVRTYFDKVGRAIRVESAGFSESDTVISKTTYDHLGRVTFESVPQFSTESTEGTHYTYADDLGRLTQKVIDQTASQELVIKYHYSGFKTNIDANGISMSRERNGLGQLVKTTDAYQGVSRYAYNGMGLPILLEDAKQQKIVAQYNALGQKEWVKDPNMGQKTFTYHGFGSVESEKDANGQLSYYHYDILGRLTQRDVDGVKEASWTYDDARKDENSLCLGMKSGETVHRLSESFSREYSYDALCRIATKTTHIDGYSFSLENHYDKNHGRLKGKTYPNNLVVGYEYNDRGFLTRTFNVGNDYTYRRVDAMNAQGQWEAVTLANNIVGIDRNYYPETGQLALSTLTKNGSELQKLIYDQYDAFGNLKKQAVDNYGLNASRGEESFDYDNLHRLIQSNRVVDNVQYRPVSYSYDAVGNLLKKTDFSIDGNNAYVYGSSERSYGNAGPNAVRRVTQKNGKGYRYYNYDNNGNLVSDSLISDGDLVSDSIRHITYNAFNKPTKIVVSGGSFLSPLDQVVTSSSTTQLYYGADQMRYKQVRDAAGIATTTFYIDKVFERTTTGTKTESKVYLDDIAVITETVDSHSAVHSIGFFHRDRLGSMAAVLDEKGAVKETHSFDPFGRPRDEKYQDKLMQVLASDVTNRGFTDHEHLDSSQIIHMNGRVYDYNLGRFMSVDPFLQEPGNSQSFNPYSYVLNNPMAGTDPSGYLFFLIPVAAKAISWGLAAYGAYETIDSGVDAYQKLSAGEVSASAAMISVGKTAAEELALKKMKMAKEAIGYVKDKAGALANKLKSKVGSNGSKSVKTDSNSSNSSTGGKDSERNSSINCVNSFLAGTLVLTKDGYRPIEELKVGDTVFSQDEHGDEQGFKRVLKTFKEWHEDDTRKLQLEDNDGNITVIFTTDEHPFFDIADGWVDADALVVGDKVATDKAGVTLTVITNEDIADEYYAYNLTVEDFHTYFVTEADVWVHNDSDNCSDGISGSGDVEDINLYRGMKGDSNGPETGASARTLGARPDTDIPVDCKGCVHPDTGGVSVAPDTPQNLPRHRRPSEHGGTGKDPVWSIKSSQLGEKLKYVQDSDTHGTIQPSKSMRLEEYQEALSETKDSWSKE
ncbi:fibronectin type III domain-containing protein [Pleionea sp. CnH1-48]|uniref:fibronectin type III domain-containing protein n=1 Tax=Pleionea sp. CnH1-48 TaxID=2954494 RepID=UPI0020976984|nr:polymorphic toxin-type HINT domain-containing protein [Pleionea sp. CnH1-48]MCO7224749.1 polymorphic toxin-type HINT domain-containing protein [Pleionea sp. CnH1-48]